MPCSRQARGRYISTSMMPQVFSSVKEALAGVNKRRSSCSALTGDNHKHAAAKDTFTTTITLLDTHEEEEVDISKYTEDDLERLRLEDPFLYYSIKRSDLFRGNSSKATSSRRSSCPTILGSADDHGQQQQQRRGSVTRARRMSTEPHPSLFIQNLMKDMDMDESLEESEEEADEELIQALANGTFYMED